MNPECELNQRPHFGWGISTQATVERSKGASGQRTTPKCVKGCTHT